MKLHLYHGICMLVGLMLTSLTGCSDYTSGLAEVEENYATRSDEWISYTISDMEQGTLESRLQELAGDNATQVNELTITGSFSSTDATYIRKNLSTSLKKLDLSAVTLQEKDFYGSNGWVSDWQEVDYLPEFFMSHMTALETIQLPNDLHTIRRQAFEECTSLTGITIPESVTSIYGSAFYGCTSLTEVTIPASVNCMSGKVFTHCTSLTSVHLLANIEQIPEYCFYGCSSLTEIELPSSVTSFGAFAFKDCSSLAQESLLSSQYTLNGIAVFYNTGYTEIDLSSSNWTKIPNYTFCDCEQLKNVKLPQGLTRLGEAAFMGCESLTEMEFSDNLDEIGNYAMAGTAIPHVVLPNSLRKIGYEAFRNAKFSTITVPESVEEIKSWLFYGCDDLYAIYWNSYQTVVGPLVYPNYSHNPYCLIYLKTGKNGLAPASYYNDRNVIIDDVAESITLSWDAVFGCKKSFTTKKISYSLNFNSSYYHYNSINIFNSKNYTTPGYSTNWQTIVLPFKPDRIYHSEKGELAPFNSEKEKAGAKPFWLRELTADGFVDCTEMEPNRPYLISMPYNPDLYSDKYNIRGTVTFEADNVVVPVIGELSPSVGPDFAMYPTYAPIEKSSDIMALGTYKDSISNLNISYFKTNVDVYPFQAYIIPTSSRSTISLGGNRSATRAAETDTRRLHKGKPRIDDM